jgi:hypothetical protein
VRPASSIAQGLAAHSAPPAYSRMDTLAVLAARIRQQATVMAFADVFFIIAVLLVGLVALLRRDLKNS